MSNTEAVLFGLIVLSAAISALLRMRHKHVWIEDSRSLLPAQPNVMDGMEMRGRSAKHVADSLLVLMLVRTSILYRCKCSAVKTEVVVGDFTKGAFAASGVLWPESTGIVPNQGAGWKQQ